MPQDPVNKELLDLMLSRTKPELDPTKAPPIPAQMLPQPPTVGNKEFLFSVKGLLDKHPELKRSVSQFRQGPTEGTGVRMVESKLPVDTFAGTNLLGGFDRTNKQIAINPDATGRELQDTLRHEAAHSQGANEMQATLLDALLDSSIDNEAIANAKKLKKEDINSLLNFLIQKKQ